MTRPRTLKYLAVGDMIAVNNLPDAERFEVVSMDGRFMIAVRQLRDPDMTVDYASQFIDRSMIQQHWQKK